MFPLEERKEWYIYDSSKLTDFISCKRLYFFRHILGWDLDFPNHDLYFGEAWHRAREHQLLNGYDDIQGAFAAFEDYYRIYFAPEDDQLHLPKTPAAALNALIKFSVERSNDLVENEVVEIDGVKMTEISGTVPVDERRSLCYRMDSVMRRRDDGMIFSWDHKTTTERWISSDQWAEQFYLGIQNGTYTHCLYCMFPINQVLGVEFCGVGFGYTTRSSAKRSAGFHATLRRVPAFKTPEQMNSWWWTVIDILDELEMEMERLHDCNESDPVLMAFRMNPGSCTNYRGCPFHDYCLSWQNPLQHCYEPPLGFKVEFWNPLEMETRNKKDLKVTFDVKELGNGG